MNDILHHVDEANPNQLAQLLAMGRPAPHARKRPNITLPMLEALKWGAKRGDGGVGYSTAGTRRALVARGLAEWIMIDGGDARISEAGTLLIRTQYEALKVVLSEGG